jgi:hypothetical protein
MAIDHNPIKIASTAIMAVGALLATIWGIDSHYATAADVSKIERNLDDKLTRFQSQHLENQIFLLDLKKQQAQGKQDPIDAAMAERYKRQLQQLDAETPRNKDAK